MGYYPIIIIFLDVCFGMMALTHGGWRRRKKQACESCVYYQNVGLYNRNSVFSCFHLTATLSCMTDQHYLLVHVPQRLQPNPTLVYFVGLHGKKCFVSVHSRMFSVCCHYVMEEFYMIKCT